MIEQLLKERILIIDGAMGTMIQLHDLNESDFRGNIFENHTSDLKGNNDILSLTRPNIIEEIHLQYFNAGADIIETNTFNANAISQLDYGLEEHVYELNYESANIAKKVAQRFSDKPRFVAGAIGPTNQTASLGPDVNNPAHRNISFDQLFEAYAEQANALIEGGVDFILIETVFDTLNCKAALFAVNNVLEKKKIKMPIFVSGTITDASGRTLSGQTTEAFITSLSHLPLLTIGFNCALGADLMLPYMKRVSRFTNFFTAAFPNAGLPNAFGEYDESSSQMGEKIRKFLDEGCVNIIGGCCGTTPDHIKFIAEIVNDFKPRKK